MLTYTQAVAYVQSGAGNAFGFVPVEEHGHVVGGAIYFIVAGTFRPYVIFAGGRFNSDSVARHILNGFEREKLERLSLEFVPTSAGPEVIEYELQVALEIMTRSRPLAEASLEA